MRAVVLIKQVPDLRAGSVSTRPDGTIDRGSAPAIVNPADLHALEAALQIADHVTAVTMGPPAAEAALRTALAHGADDAVLLTDRQFAGSDTWATANVIARAIERLGSVDVITCGLTALDGETGQVGPQVAERLGIPHATGCEALTARVDRLEARRVVEGGYEVVSLPFPALISITETGFTPRYPTWPLRRRAAAADISTWSADDLQIEPDRAGLAASPTKVAHMEPVPLPAVTTRWLGTDLDYDQLAGEMHALVRSAPAPMATPVASDAAYPRRRPVELPRSLWVVCERQGAHLAAVSAELLSASVELAAELDCGVAAFLAGADVSEAAQEAADHGADLVLTAEDPRLDPYRSLPHARVLTDEIRRRNPDIVLLGATSTGRDLAARVAARLDTGLAADCTDLRIGDWTRRGTTYEKLLHQVRPAMGHSVLATCLSPTARPQMATIRPGVFTITRRPIDAHHEPVRVDLEPQDLALEVVSRTVQDRDVRLQDAEVIVAGGAGCGREGWHLVERLADALGGQVGASRAAVDAGLVSRARQIGQTGSTVSPSLYVAAGVSGAFQHVVGMQAAKTVVAINRDPEAPIFQFAHYGVVGDVADVLPRLTEALERQTVGT